MSRPGPTDQASLVGLEDKQEARTLGNKQKAMSVPRPECEISQTSRAWLLLGWGTPVTLHLGLQVEGRPWY